MYCNVCVADNDGCVEQPPTSECAASGDVTSGTTSDGATTTSTSTSSTTAMSAPTSPGSGPTSDAPTASDSSGGAEGPAGPVCGDGVVEPPEQCDGEGIDCDAFGADTDEAPCTADCIYNLSACRNAPVCGDGVVEPPEPCEPDVELRQTCEGLSNTFVGGELSCTKNCTYDTTECDACAPPGLEGCTPGECCPGSTCECVGVGALQVCSCQES